MRKRLWFDTETGNLYRKDISEVYHDVDGKLSDLTNDETMKIFQFSLDNPFVGIDIIENEINYIEDDVLREILLDLYDKNKDNEDSSFVEKYVYDERINELVIVLKDRWNMELRFPATLKLLKALQSDLELIKYFVEMGI